VDVDVRFVDPHTSDIQAWLAVQYCYRLPWLDYVEAVMTAAIMLKKYRTKVIYLQ